MLCLCLLVFFSSLSVRSLEHDLEIEERFEKLSVLIDNGAVSRNNSSRVAQSVVRPSCTIEKL